MSRKVTLQPSGHSFEVPDGQTVLRAGLDAGYSMPYSCRTGVCRTCRGTIQEGTVDYGMVHSTYLPDSDKAKGYALLCQAKPLSDLVIEVRELEGLAGIRTRTVPCRVAKIDRPAPDVTVLGLRLPMNENMLFLAGQYVDFLLTDGKRRSYSIASKPSSEGVTAIELHVRHTPGGLFTDHVFAAMKERDLLRFEGPLGTFYIRTDSDKPDRDGRERHRLRAHQGDVRGGVRAGHQRVSPDGALLGLPYPQGSVRSRAADAMGSRAGQLPLCPGALRPDCRVRLDRTHRFRASCRDGRSARHGRRAGLCVSAPRSWSKRRGPISARSAACQQGSFSPTRS